MRLFSFDVDHVNEFKLRNQSLEVSDADRTAYSRQRSYEPIVGIALTSGSDASETYLNYASQLSRTRSGSPSAVFIDGTEEISVRDRPWVQQLVRQKTRFAAENSLGNRVVARMSGLASSPTGYFVATCFSLHPSELIQYATDSQMESSLVISNESEWLLESGVRDVLGCTLLTGM